MKITPIVTWENTVEFIPPIDNGIVIKVYDGDTITIATTLPIINSPLYRFSVRLNGIDTPEIKGNTDDEKNAATEVKNILTTMLLNKKVVLKNLQNEKYGRILADVYLDNLCINEWLLRERLAVKYDGGTKKTPSSWLRYKLIGEL
jgi:endonuclease YncB( thermonuclease family)